VRPSRFVEGAVVASILGVGVALRLVHVGTPSLWWDELLQIHTAGQRTMLDVLRFVRSGPNPRAGNAGAMPLDYLLLHAWTRLVPAPAAEWREAYYRLPSCIASCLTLPLLWACARELFGRATAILATLLLALSLPHVLYAAEARVYSLLMLGSVASLWAFARVVRRGDRRDWATFAAVSLVYAMTGLLALLVLVVEYVTLLVLRGGQAGRRGALAGSAVAVAVAVALAVRGTPIGLKYGRPAALTLNPWTVTVQVLDFFAGSSRSLFWASVAAPPVAIWWARRHAPDRLPIVVALTASLLAIPAIALLARWKEYYVHPRHALLVLPYLLLLIAVALRALLVRPARPTVGLLVAAACIVAAQGPIARAYVAYPSQFFSRTKKVWDLKGLARDLSRRTAEFPPGTRYLLVGDGKYPGYQGNACLTTYLDWWGLRKRVVFRSTDDARVTLERVRAAGPDACRGRKGPGVERQLQLGAVARLGPVGAFLHLAEIGAWPSVLDGCGIVAYGGPALADAMRAFAQRRYEGFVLAEPR